MKRFALWLALGLLFGNTFAGQAHAAGSPIAESMGDLRWGMSDSEVLRYIEGRLNTRYDAAIKKNKARAASLKTELKDKVAAAKKSVVEFSGRSSRWDSSPAAGEFTYGNNESMVAYDEEGAQNYYFFINGRLWKWVKALPKASFGAKGYATFSKSIEKHFGKGREKSAERIDGQGQRTWLEYLDRMSRMRAVDNASSNGTFALVFEEMDTVRELASLRSNTPAPSRSRGRSVDDSSSRAESSVAAKSTSSGAVQQAKQRKSLFGDEQQGETQEQYKARADRDQASKREHARDMHDRKEAKKQGEALKPIDNLNDSDPLSGL